MKNNKGCLNVVLIFLIFLSCEKHDQTVCEGSGASGLICKELRYQDEVPTEVVIYEYDSKGLVVRKLHENGQGQNLGQIKFTYNNSGQLLARVSRDDDNKVIRSENYIYNEQGQRAHYMNKIHKVKTDLYYTYEDFLLKEVVVYLENELTSVVKYSYFSDDTSSYDRSTFDAQATFIEVEEVRRFDTQTKRVETFNQSGLLEGYKVLLYGDDAALLEIKTFDAEQSLLEHETYFYQNKLLKEHHVSYSNRPNQAIEYLRFN